MLRRKIAGPPNTICISHRNFFPDYARSSGRTFTFFTMFAMFFVMSQYLQSVRGYSPLKAGFATLPFAVASIAVSPRGAALSARFEPRRVVVVGMCIVPFGLLIVGTLLAGALGRIIGERRPASLAVVSVPVIGGVAVTAPAIARIIGG